MIFLESNSLLPLSQFSCPRGLRTCNALLTLFHHLQVALDMGGKACSARLLSALDRISHCGLLYKLKSIRLERQFHVHSIGVPYW